MKKNLEIIECEHKITKAGKPFMRFQTNEGWMSCFDVKEIEKLKKFKGQTASVEIIESGEFSNIKKCYGEEQDEDKEEVEVVKMNPPEYVNPKAHGPMYTSYAKDLVVAGKTPEDAEAIIKRLKEAFE